MSTHTRTRRQIMLMALGTFAGAALAPIWAHAQEPGDLSATVRMFESTNMHNAYPDECDGRLQRLYIAEGLELTIEAQFNRVLTDDEAQAVQWSISNDSAELDAGDFAGQSNPARITTTLSADPGREANEAVLRVTHAGVDLADPLPLRIISDAEYAAAYASLSGFVTRSSDSANRLPFASDLLSRFLGLESTAAGTPSIGVYPLNICDPRLTHRAGADWGASAVTDVPLVQYESDQPAAEIVGEAVALAVLSEHAAEIRQLIAQQPDERAQILYAHDGNLTLDLPLDANLALHGVQFDGTVAAIVDASGGPDAPLTARSVHVTGTVADVYDFNLEAGGVGAFPATEAAKLEIASIKHGKVGKVFAVQLNLDTSIEEVRFDPVRRSA